MNRLALLLALVTGFPVHAGENYSVIFSEMARLGTRTMQIAPNGGNFDEYPLWSVDGTTLAVNYQGTWLLLNAESFVFAGADWHNELIGYLVGADEANEADSGKIAKMKENSFFGGRRVDASDGSSVMIRSSGLGVQFVQTDVDGKEEIWWSSDLDNCYSPSMSPDETLIAFICGAGVFIADIR